MRLGRRLSTGTAEDPAPTHPAETAPVPAVEDAAPAPEVTVEVRREYADAADR